MEIFNCIKEKANGEPVCFYLSSRNWFEILALHCCKEYQKFDPEAKIIYVSPFRGELYFKDRPYIKAYYDEIIIPDNIYYDYSNFNRIKRTKWIIRKSDLVIAFINYGWDYAGKMMEYVIKHKIPYVNFGRKKYE